MTPEHPTKTPSPRTGIFALLWNVLRAKGTTIPSGTSGFQPNRNRLQPRSAAGKPSEPRVISNQLSVAGIRQPQFFALTLVVLSVTVFVLSFLGAVAPGVASANSAHGPSGVTLGSGPGSAAGQLELVAPFREVAGREFPGSETNHYYSIAGSGVAVNDANHDVYVADTGNHRISEFNKEGNFDRAFGAEVESPLGDVCTASCQKGGVGLTPGNGELSAELPSPRFVAVDNSTNPADHSKGDVYVGEGVGTPAQNERQFVEINGAIGGSFTLTYEGKETSAIPYSPTSPHGEDKRDTTEALEAATGDVVEVQEDDDSHGETALLIVEFVGVLKESVTGALSCNGADLAPAGTKCETNVKHTGSKPVQEMIEKFGPDGTLETGWGDGGPGGTPDGRLDVGSVHDGYLQGVAVDPSGNLWAEDGGYVYRFGEADNQIAPPTKVYGPEPAEGIAVNAAGELYYAAEAVEKVKESTLGGEQVFIGGNPVSAAHDPGPTGFALDTASEAVYLGLGDVLEQGIPAEVFGAPQLQGSSGVAVDSSTTEPPFSGAVYAANTVSDQVDVDTLRLAAETSAASEVAVASMTLHGFVNPEGTRVEECIFEYGTSEEYEATVPCEEKPEAIGSVPGEVPVEAKISGLRGGTTYHFRVVARKGSTIVPGKDMHASTPPVAILSGEEAGEVTGSSARLTALVDPEGLPVTRCRFEYGTSTSYRTVLPCEQRPAQIGFGTEPVPVSAQITGLEANITYHWRLSVGDPNGEVSGSDHTFVYPASNSELPDHRAYEMVTPPFKNGASAGTILFGENGAGLAENGERVIAMSVDCFAGSLSCTGTRDEREGEPFAFTRTNEPEKCRPSAPPCWYATSLAPPSTVFAENNPWLIDANEGSALFSMPTPLPAGKGEDDFYVRNPETGAFADVGSVTPPVAGPSKNLSSLGDPVATADFSHLVVNEQSGEAIVWPFEAPRGQRVIEWACTSREQAKCGATEPFLVGVNGEGKPFAGCQATLGGPPEDAGVNPLSADGRTVYFTTTCAHEDEQQLYARVDAETSEAHTVKISGAGAANFVGASADGSRAFFIEDENLFESECTAHCQGSGAEERDEHRESIDVSAGEGGAPIPGEDPEVQGVTAISADGSHVYFVANGTLAPGAHRGHCPAAGSSCNLYVYERDTRYPDGHIAFVARLPQADAEHDWRSGSRTANVTPDGSYLVFESQGDLTPDDTRSDGYSQVFRYDADPSPAEEANHVPALIRISVGANGFDDDGNGGVGDAAIKPPTIGESADVGSGRGDPTMSDDGSYVFFQSPVGLTANALNDVVLGHGGPFDQPGYAQNVYEWEAPGTVLDERVACMQSGGCIYLISDGRDVSEGTGNEPCKENHAESETPLSATCLLGTNSSGHNVFFYTADQLVPKDTDTQVDVYDARICEPEQGNPCVTEPPPTQPPCEGEQCHGIPEPTPSLLAPGTATFNGEGNVTQPPPTKPAIKKKTVKCRKGFVKKHNKCVRSKKRAKKSTHTDRRAHR
jgi:hypothetical protein